MFIEVFGFCYEFLVNNYICNLLLNSWQYVVFIVVFIMINKYFDYIILFE